MKATLLKQVSGTPFLFVMVLGLLLVFTACSSASVNEELDVQARGKGKVTVSPTPGVFGETAMVTANPGGDDIWVYAECYQGDVRVYRQWVKTDSNNQAALTLGPTLRWTDGDADCIAEEGYYHKTGRWRSVAKTAFNVID